MGSVAAQCIIYVRLSQCFVQLFGLLNTLMVFLAISLWGKAYLGAGAASVFCMTVCGSRGVVRALVCGG